jgi:hypothetical protein
MFGVGLSARGVFLGCAGCCVALGWEVAEEEVAGGWLAELRPERFWGPIRMELEPVRLGC